MDADADVVQLAPPVCRALTRLQAEERLPVRSLAFRVERVTVSLAAPPAAPGVAADRLVLDLLKLACSSSQLPDMPEARWDLDVHSLQGSLHCADGSVSFIMGAQVGGSGDDMSPTAVQITLTDPPNLAASPPPPPMLMSSPTPQLFPRPDGPFHGLVKLFEERKTTPASADQDAREFPEKAKKTSVCQLSVLLPLILLPQRVVVQVVLPHVWVTLAKQEFLLLMRMKEALLGALVASAPAPSAIVRAPPGPAEPLTSAMTFLLFVSTCEVTVRDSLVAAQQLYQYGIRLEDLRLCSVSDYCRSGCSYLLLNSFNLSIRDLRPGHLDDRPLMTRTLRLPPSGGAAPAEDPLAALAMVGETRPGSSDMQLSLFVRALSLELADAAWLMRLREFVRTPGPSTAAVVHDSLSEIGSLALCR
jgi:hypothetical protein